MNKLEERGKREWKEERQVERVRTDASDDMFQEYAEKFGDKNQLIGLTTSKNTSLHGS